MTNQLAVVSDMPLGELGQVLAKSGFFTDSRDANQAIVKVLAGRELGFGPIASMKGVYIIQGGPSISANLMAAAVKRTTKYNYHIERLTDELCEIIFYEGGKEAGRSIFTASDAKKAGTKNMEKFPRNMLFARAMSNGVRWYCPDIFGGPIYTPEELGANVNEDGDVIDTTAKDLGPTNGKGSKPAPEPDPVPAPAATMSLEMAKSIKSSEGVLYGDLTSEDLSNRSIGLGKKLAQNNLTASAREEAQMKMDAIATILASRKAVA